MLNHSSIKLFPLFPHAPRVPRGSFAQSRTRVSLTFDVFLEPVAQRRPVKPKILSNQKEQMAYLVLDLTLIALTGPSQNCYNELALLHKNLSITYSEPLSDWGALFLHLRQTEYLEARR